MVNSNSWIRDGCPPIEGTFVGTFQKFEEIPALLRVYSRRLIAGGNVWKSYYIVYTKWKWGGNDAWNEKSSKEGNGIYVLSFERLVGTPWWGCTSFWVTSFTWTLAVCGRSFVRSTSRPSILFSNLSFIYRRDLFKENELVISIAKIRFFRIFSPMEEYRTMRRTCIKINNRFRCFQVLIFRRKIL